MAKVAPFGSWASSVTPASLVAQTVALADPVVAGSRIYWNERRPNDGGRQVIVARDENGTLLDVIDAPFSARTRVHEYGGSCVAIDGAVAYFSNDTDQRVYRVAPGAAPQPITPEPEEPGGLRYGDFELGAGGSVIYAVREHHLAGEVRNELVLLDATGGTAPVVVATGHDFYAAPRLSSDGRRLAYLTWDHPNMPWDSTSLLVAELGADGLPVSEQLLAGGEGISISQPRFSPAGTLCYLSDETGFWLPFDELGHQLAPGGHDYGGPDWVLGQRSYVFLADGSLYAARFADGTQQLGRCTPDSFTPLALDWRVFGGLSTDGARLIALAGSPSASTSLVAINPSNASVEVLRQSRDGELGATISEPRPITFTGGTGEPTHALYYPPANEGFVGPPGERPPLVVLSHGGPTSAAMAVLDLTKQLFTSRGFGVVDVNYGGSSGYGRAYRERLRGRWGLLDVADCVAAATHLGATGEVDADRLVIRGGSAGGYTTLSAISTTDVFAAGSSHYGVSDLAGLASDTHKFESRYLDGLVGPWPEARAVYAERSPLEHADAIRCPVIFFQGLDDRVVPPDQARRLVEALRGRSVPVAYLEFEGESHGFRRAATIETVAGAELTFLGAVFGFEPDCAIDLEIDHASQLRSAG